ncbi:hypothetical protein DITRI_Ditri20bG0030300 [Diplodiscus trichospermus]
MPQNLKASTLSRVLAGAGDDDVNFRQTEFHSEKASKKIKGKICKSEIRNALIHMGVEKGIPPFSGSLPQLQASKESLDICPAYRSDRILGSVLFRVRTAGYNLQIRSIWDCDFA